MRHARPSTFKKLCILILTIFVFQQPVWANPDLLWDPLRDPQEISVEEQLAREQEEKQPEEVPFDTTQFLLEDGGIFPIEEERLLEEPRETERHSVEEALEMMRPGVAVAVVLESIEAEDLERIQSLSFETGLAVLYGELVLFSSGTEDEISVLSGAYEMLNDASLIAHTHPSGSTNEGPSAYDIAHAVEGEQVEYVISEDSILAYNQKGVQGELTREEFVNIALEQRTMERDRNAHNPAVTRAALHEFVAEMDLFNEWEAAEKLTFREAPVGTPITTLQQLQDIANDLSGSYYLAADIDASATATWNGGLGFDPIGTRFDAFTGSFDGNGFKITGLTINRPSEDYVGLFGAFVSAGEIKNIALENVSIAGRHNVGAVSGYQLFTTSSEISVTGGTVTGDTRVGGLIGESYNGWGIHDAYSNVGVFGNHRVGGIVGKLWDGSINDVIRSSAVGTVDGNTHIGGLVGYAKSGDILESYFSGSVLGLSSVGGLAGNTTENAGIHNSYVAAGGVVVGRGGDHVGGIAGLYGSFHDGITKTYFAGQLTNPTGPEGAFIGTYTGTNSSRYNPVWAVIEDNYWDSNLNPGFQDSAAGDMDGIESRTTSEMQTQSTYVNWDFDRTWNIAPNSYPFLDIAKPITTLAELQAMQDDLDGRYYLAADIDATETATWNGGLGFDPIGTRFNAFTGGFNGNGFKISNLTINRPNEDYVGLFGAFESTREVRNIELENVSIVGRNNVGAVSGYQFFTTISNISAVGGTVDGSTHVGGIVGESYNGWGIHDALSQVNVTGAYRTGGIVGKLWDGTINDVLRSAALGTVTGGNETGGLAGYAKSGDLLESYATGNVTGADSVGGLVGRTTENGGIHNSYYASGDVVGTGGNVGGIAGLYGSFHDGITKTYFAGTVTNVTASNPTNTAGAFVGAYTGPNSSRYNPVWAAIEDNHWDSDLNPGLQDNASGDMTGIDSHDTPTMKTQSTYVNWDFQNVWQIDTDYPYLQQAPVSEFPPVTGSVLVNNGATYVNTPYTLGTFSASATATEVTYVVINEGETPNFIFWGPITPNTSIWVNNEASGGNDGVKVLHAKYRDAHGNESPVYTDDFIVDSVAPTGTLVINNGDDTTNDPNVTLALTHSEALSSLRYSTDGGSNWTVLSSVPTALTLPSGDGLVEVQFELTDLAGNVSAVISDTITLDETAPSINVDSSSVHLGQPGLGQTYRDFRFTVTGSDATTGLGTILYNIYDETDTLVSSFGPVSFSSGDETFDLRFPEGWGSRRVELIVTDLAGNQTPLDLFAQVSVTDYLMDENFKYFLNPYGTDHGAFELSHSYPHEGYNQRLYTQPTHFGFGAQLLANVIAERVVVDSLTRDQAISILKNMATQILADQTDPSIGVMGLLPWMNYDSSSSDWRRDHDYGTGKDTVNGRRFMFGDNANMSVAFATALGALAGAEDNTDGDVAAIKTALQSFLTNQTAGYQCLASSTNNPHGGVRRGIIISSTQPAGSPVADCNAVFNGGSNVAFVNVDDTPEPNTEEAVAFEDLYASEFRAGILFAVINHGLNDSVYKHLSLEMQDYTMQGGETVFTVAPVDGGAFQMLWPTLSIPESGNASLAAMHADFLDVVLDFAAERSHPGLLSAAYGQSGYLPNIGIADIAHNSSGRNETSTSVYTLGAAYGMDPARITPFLESVAQNYPTLLSAHGMWEGVDMSGATGTVIQEQVFSNIATFLLGILNTGTADMEAYLTTAQEDQLDALLDAPVGPDQDIVAAPPNAFSWGDVNRGQSAPITSGRTGDTYRVQTSSLHWVATAFQHGDGVVHNTSGKRLLISYRASSDSGPGTNVAANLEVEFKGVDRVKIHQEALNIELLKTSGSDVNTVFIDFPDYLGASAINEIVLVLKGSGDSVDVTFEDVDLIARGSTVPLTATGGGTGGKSATEIAKSQERTLAAGGLFAGFLLEELEGEQTENEKKRESTKKAKRSGELSKEEAKAEKKKLKEERKRLNDIQSSIQKIENDIAKLQEDLAKKGSVEEGLLDQVVSELSLLYELLFEEPLGSIS